MSFFGFVENSDNLRLLGWAVSEAGESCELVLEINDAEALRVQSNGRRWDLEDRKISSGYGGFDIDLTPHLGPGENKVRVLFPDGSLVTNSAVTMYVPMPPEAGACHGYVENFDAGDLRGWALTANGESCSLSASVNGSPILAQESNGERHDLVQRGLSKKFGGFSFNLEPFLRDGENVIIVSFPDGTPVKGTPLTIIHQKPRATPVELPDHHVEHLLAPHDEKSQAVETRVSAGGQERVQRARDANEIYRGVRPPTPAATGTPSGHLKGRGGSLDKFGRAHSKMPSLSELDEISLDDLSLAVAAGLVATPPKSHAVEDSGASPEMSQESQQATAHEELRPRIRTSFLKKLLGRRGSRP